MITGDGRGFEATGVHRGPGRGSSEAVELLEEMLRSMVSDDELHPDIEDVYAALCEIETWAAAERRDDHGQHRSQQH